METYVVHFNENPEFAVDAANLQTLDVVIRFDATWVDVPGYVEWIVQAAADQEIAELGLESSDFDEQWSATWIEQSETGNRLHI